MGGRDISAQKACPPTPYITNNWNVREGVEVLVHRFFPSKQIDTAQDCDLAVPRCFSCVASPRGFTKMMRLFVQQAPIVLLRQDDNIADLQKDFPC